MLRIGQPPPQPPGPPQGPAGAPPAGLPPELLQALSQGQGGDPGAPSPDPSAGGGKPQKFDIDKVDPKLAGYVGPDAVCGKCSFFDGQSTCSIVSGDIDATWHCNLFTGQDAPDKAEASPEDPSADPNAAPPEGA